MSDRDGTHKTDKRHYFSRIKNGVHQINEGRIERIGTFQSCFETFFGLLNDQKEKETTIVVTCLIFKDQRNDRFYNLF